MKMLLPYAQEDGGGESQAFLRLPHAQVHFTSSIVF